MSVSLGTLLPTSAPSRLDASSILWRYFGDWRLGLVLGRGLVLQTCHPTIGAGVAEHSMYRENPWGRLNQSLMPIVDTIYAPDGDAIGARIREAHRTIRGTDHQGRKYHAWEPEAYWFVLATALDSVIVMSELYCDRSIAGGDRDRLVVEMREVGLRMGLRERDMPVGWRDFSDYYDTLLAERLEDHPTAHEVLDTIAHVPPPEWLPLNMFSGRILSPPVGHLMTLTTVGTLPPIVRERLGLSWSRSQQRELLAVASAVRATFRVLPRHRRYMPAARDAFGRARFAA